MEVTGTRSGEYRVDRGAVQGVLVAHNGVLQQNTPPNHDNIVRSHQRLLV